MQNDIKCCLCSEKLPSCVMRTPFEYGENEFPKVYAPICEKCFERCKSGEITKAEFIKKAKNR